MENSCRPSCGARAARSSSVAPLAGAWVETEQLEIAWPVGTIRAPLTRAIAFCDNHAIGLSRLVGAIGREDLGNALDEVIAEITGAAQNAERAAYAVSALRDALAEVRVAELDEVATKTSTVGDSYATLTWYGARLSDLAAGLRAAGDGTTS